MKCAASMPAQTALANRFHLTMTRWPSFLLLAFFAMAGCRKMPTAPAPHDAGSPAPRGPPPAAQAGVESKPDAVAQGTPEPARPSMDLHARVVVLGYERFVTKVQHPDTEITPTEFQAQMQALKDAGIAVISLDDLLAWRQGKKNIPARSALITIDDGYNTAYVTAWPILKQFGYPFTVFVYTDYVKGGKKAGGGSMSWDQLAEMRDAGVSIGSETVSHSDLRKKKKDMSDAAYDAWLWDELRGSKAEIEKRLGVKVTALALPLGHADDHVREVAAKAGYDMLFTVSGQMIGANTPLNALGRCMVQGNKPAAFTAATSFAGQAKGNSVALGGSEVSAQSIHAEPAPGATIESPNLEIHANLAGWKTIDPASVSLRLSGRGKLPARFDPQTKVISCRVQGLSPSEYTVILDAQAEDRKVECRWNFTVKASPTTPPKAPTATAH
jgi:peptidoglycan/xylan/chitin deacetylase (PgdA/CDA1 family)